MKEKRIFFISGHRDITYREYTTLYLPKIIECIDKYDAYFIMGDYEGVDIMAQNTLMGVLEYPTDKVTVYHMSDKPRNAHPFIKNFIGGFKTDEERDYAMSSESHEDIAFVRCGRFDSGTAQNIIRRYAFFSNSNGTKKYLK